MSCCTSCTRRKSTWLECDLRELQYLGSTVRLAHMLAIQVGRHQGWVCEPHQLPGVRIRVHVSDRYAAIVLQMAACLPLLLPFERRR